MGIHFFDAGRQGEEKKSIISPFILRDGVSSENQSVEEVTFHYFQKKIVKISLTIFNKDETSPIDLENYDYSIIFDVFRVE